jgi:hypothetical protein
MSDVLLEKWDAVLNSDKLESITDLHRKRVTAQLLENQQASLLEAQGNVDANIATWDPVLVSMVRRMAPKLIAYDVCGVQPLTMPTGIIFALKAKYTDRNGSEAMGINEVDTSFSGTGTHSTADTAWSTITTGVGVATATAEADITWGAMAMTIEKMTVTAKTRQLRADYSLELAQDLKSVHGLDAETELTNILANEITSELNREVVRSIYFVAKPGAQWTGITTAGEFDVTADSDGRYHVEKFKGLYYAIQRDANAIAVQTRRGKGNFVIASSDVASALSLCGVLDYTPALDSKISLDVDPAGVTYCGTMGGMKVYIDPYLGFDGYVVGYKGSNPWDQGLVYSPYVPLQMFKATDPVQFTPTIGFKHRYSLTETIWAHNNANTLVQNGNPFYRKVLVKNLQVA